MKRASKLGDVKPIIWNILVNLQRLFEGMEVGEMNRC
jgi:hypothetical protein